MLALFLLIPWMALPTSSIAQERSSRQIDALKEKPVESVDNQRNAVGNAGREDLERASDLKMVADDITKYSQIIDLIEGSMAKGMDESDKAFARDLLASSALERARLRHSEMLMAKTGDKKAGKLQRKSLVDLKLAVAINPNLTEASFLIAKLTMGTNPRLAKESLDHLLRNFSLNLGQRSKAYAMRSILQDSEDQKQADLNQAMNDSKQYLESRQRDVDRGFNCPQIFDVPQVR